MGEQARPATAGWQTARRPPPAAPPPPPPPPPGTLESARESAVSGR
ncbi:hypothetical protein [Nocardia brasiliensis]|nr:hypothetical protein [Nocardia brasiliensis]